MRLKVLLPFEVFLDEDEVQDIVAQGQFGAFGLLPQRRDCVAALAPGILTYRKSEAEEVNLAVDEGLLVKAGQNVTISTRQAILGNDLGSLRQAVESDFKHRQDQELSMRTALVKMEDTLLRSVLELSRGER